ncbi:hypothetical protein Barb6_00031 [Bacteroidales bacterium Barb6]|nr:hypothetical protein Barb6_00031 [Bacteroidales bacterium Barb6]
MQAPSVNVGILNGQALSFAFCEKYIHAETGRYLTGGQRAVLVSGKILFDGKLYRELFFEPDSPTAVFELKNVVIGKNFHWQQKENEQFRGALNLFVANGTIWAVNEVNMEDYLSSVISSEMSDKASEEFLKAHAVVSRSWLLAQMEKSRRRGHKSPYPNSIQEGDRFIRWFDKEEHNLFDVCADDHCQRYQGIRISSPVVEKVIRETFGEILADGQKICDARFAKCCGGVTEKFEHCWEPVPHAYLTAVRDSNNAGIPDLTDEAEAEKWIRSSPQSYCNVTDEHILAQVLTHYDQKTTDFYRWGKTYTQAELSTLIEQKGRYGFGYITDLQPVKRGASGRIEELRIVGTNKTLVVGKELEIRRLLSDSHLYSSAFVVDKEGEQDGLPDRFTLIGAGWGHGVGLCQIGAAVMAAKGIGYKDILAHYYPGTSVEKRY